MKTTLVALSLLLILCSPAVAGSKGKLAGFFADYDDVKTRTAERFSEIDQARKDGYSSDVQSILALIKEIAQINTEVRDYYYVQSKQARSSRSPQPDQRTLLAMMEAYKALEGALFAETTYQTGAKSPFLLLVRAKYEELFRLADEEIGRAKTESVTATP